MPPLIALSWFHRKIGPINAYVYPENVLDEDLSIRIANIMDQTINEGFFTHSFENFYSMNYYFEINSDWARGNKEMLMLSVIFDHQTTLEIERKILKLCLDFSKTLQRNDEIFTAFYLNDITYYDEEDQKAIIKNDNLVRLLVKDLYRTTIEETREKSEEEKIAIQLNKKHIFLTLRKLSKGPLTLEDLREWYDKNFPDKGFNELINILIEKQFIFINQIGRVDKYVLLLKEVNAERIPPFSVIEYIDRTPDLISIILPKVQEYFSAYENKTEEELLEDSLILFQIIADPLKYNVLSKLRNGLIPSDNLQRIVSKRTLDSLKKTIDFLKDYDVIEELEYNGENYIVLKTNLQITTSFPQWMRKLLPKETEPVVANKYRPREENLKKDTPVERVGSFFDGLSNNSKSDR